MCGLRPPRASLFKYLKKYRLRKRSDFLRVQSGKRKFHGRHFLVIVEPGETADSRLGIVITRKVDSRAVYRNKLRRRIREVFRLNRFRFIKNFDIVVIARRDACACEFAEVKSEILGIFSRAGMLKKHADQLRGQ